MLITNALLYLDEGTLQADLRLRDGRIAEIGPGLAPGPGEEVLDAEEMPVLPGFIDFHVHLHERIGTFDLADTFRTGTQAALPTGITTVIDFATQREGTLTDAVRAKLDKVRAGSFCDVALHLTPTRFGSAEWDEIAGLVLAGFRTYKTYTTYKSAGLFLDYSQLNEVMPRLAALGARTLVHCEDSAVLEGIASTAAMLKNPWFHTVLRPPSAEVTAIRKVLELAERHHAPVHIVHVSTPEGMALIRSARKKAPVTCETAPHYLLLDDSHLKGRKGARYLCSPPLRGEEMQVGMLSLARAGAFDLFATDHCAFRREDKDSSPEDFRRVPNGLAGLGGLVPLMHEVLVQRGRMGLEELVTRLSRNPAKLAGLYPRKGTLQVGADADLVLTGPPTTPRPIRSSLADCYETWPGRTTTMNIRRVFLRGVEVVRDNALLQPGQPTGQPIWTI